ncbi:hypothetical protein J7L05_01810 [bacterium]|nr:hypothetical protein [bacterium]
MVFDNPFTGFQSCPNCGAKMTVLVNEAQKVIKMQAEAMKFARMNAHEFFNHISVFAPLTALFLFLATLVTVVNLVDSALFTRISGFIIIAAIMMLLHLPNRNQNKPYSIPGLFQSA